MRRRTSASDVGLGGDVEFDRVACGEPELVESAHVLRIGDRDLQRLAGERERQRARRAPARRAGWPCSPLRRRRRRRGRRAAGGTARRANGRSRASSRRLRRSAPARRSRRARGCERSRACPSDSRPVSPTSSATSSLRSRVSGAVGAAASPPSSSRAFARRSRGEVLEALDSGLHLRRAPDRRRPAVRRRTGRRARRARGRARRESPSCAQPSRGEPAGPSRGRAR